MEKNLWKKQSSSILTGLTNPVTYPPPLEMEYDASKPVIDLPMPENIKIRSFDLRDAIEGRRSTRSYSKEPLTIEELSYLLWVTQGVVQVTPGATFRIICSVDT